MYTLDCLPTDALLGITELLSGRDVGCLWLLGNTRLNTRLGAGGGVKSFRLTLDSLFPAKWPSLVRHFSHLEEFTIHHIRGEILKHEWLPCYSELSPTVRRLNFSLPSDFWAFFAALRSGCAFPCLEELTGLYVAPDLPLNAAEAADHVRSSKSRKELHSFLSLLPTSLTSLHFSGPLELALPLPPSSWPRQLRKLTIACFIEDRESGDEALPIGLESLDLSTYGPHSINRTRWPPNLQRLVLSEESGAAVTADDLARLPRCLTHLNWPLYQANIDENIFLALPPHLTELDLHLLRPLSEWVALLPSTLTRAVDLPARGENLQFPPALTSVDYLFHEPSSYKNLPAGVRSIKGGRAAGVGPLLAWPKLPDSLTSTSDMDLMYLDQHAFPACLQELPLHEGFLFSKRLERFVSSKITNLSLFECVFDEKVLIDNLPPQLTKLYVFRDDIMTIDDSGCEKLPKSLLRLKMSGVRFTGPNPLSCLPRDLEELGLVPSSLEVGCLGANGACLFPKLGELTLLLGTLPQGLEQHIFATLPRRMKYLTVIGLMGHEFDLTDESLASLPPGLVSLDVGAAPKITGSWLKKKPVCLQEIRFDNKRDSKSVYKKYRQNAFE